jgi:hypothetical protein
VNQQAEANAENQTPRTGDRRKGERRKVMVGQRKPCGGNAQITVRKKDEVVQTIQVNCTCGEEILIDCVYPDAA